MGAMYDTVQNNSGIQSYKILSLNRNAALRAFKSADDCVK